MNSTRSIRVIAMPRAAGAQRFVLLAAINIQAFVLSAPGTARADEAKSLFETHFASQQGGAPCYARSYDAAHLEVHPKQRVARIEIDMAKANANGRPMTEDDIQLGLGLQLRSSPEWYGNVADCKSAGAEIDCLLGSDGGKFTLSAAEDGGLKLETGDYGLAFEGEKDAIELPGDKADDRVFILQPAPRAECDAATADVLKLDP